MSQFNLFKQRRFAPFFWAQAAGAANDNLLKFAVTMLLTYHIQVKWLPGGMAGLLIGALFISPFLLFSATAGQLADKIDKKTLIILVKKLEIAIAALAGVGLYFEQPLLLLACVFLFGLHSTFFGPVKYSYLPQHLGKDELTGGNGLVEMGTFVSILLGNLAGGYLSSLPKDSWIVSAHAVALACFSLAALGLLAANLIPSSPSSDPTLKVQWNPFTVTWQNLKLAYPYTAVFRSLLGISWMWLFGAIFLAQFPSFAKDVLKGNEAVASLLLAVFSVGVATGSLMCENLSRRMVEIGLVPLGALGMTVFGVDLWAAAAQLPPTGEAYSLKEFLLWPAHWRVLADLFALSASAGLFSVPMYALIQSRSPETHRSRIIAANNILNALFMVVGSLGASFALSAGLSIPELFLGVAVLNAFVACYIFYLVPEYFLRFVAFLLTRLAYRFRVVGLKNVPESGPAVLVANHVSFADAVLLMAASPRPVRFVMDHRIFSTPLLGWFFKIARAIPVAPKSENSSVYEKAFVDIDAALANDELVCIFPEGGITRDGHLQPFRKGVTKILGQRPVPVVPMAIHGMWGSFFSRAHGRAMSRPFVRGFRSRVVVNIGEPVAAEEATPEELQRKVSLLQRL